MRYRDCENCGSEIDSREIVTRCTECGENIYKNPKTETMNKFKEKDRVFHILHGWGNIESISTEKSIVVKFENKIGSTFVDIRLISFTEYTLQGFTQERPFEPVIGQMYYFWDDNMLTQKRVICAFYKGYGDKKLPYSIQSERESISYQNISETNPLL
jgi:hypothetical protein